MKKWQKTLLKYAVPTAIGAALSLAVMSWRGAFDSKGAAMTVMAISDGFFVTAVLYVGYGLLLVAAHSGTLDIITYGFKSLIYLFAPVSKKRDEGGFYEYKVRQREKRKAIPFQILWVGLAFLAAAFIFASLFETL